MRTKENARAQAARGGGAGRSAGLVAAAAGQRASRRTPAHPRFVQPDTIFKTTIYTLLVEVKGGGRPIYTSSRQGRGSGREASAPRPIDSPVREH